MATELTYPTTRQAKSQIWAKPGEWERCRTLIKKLYVDEDMKLKEVIDIMARDHGHHGTIKMYKSRITTWGLDKNIRERDAKAILRKKTKRDAVGKDSLFRVRGKPISLDDILRHIKRKGISNLETIGSQEAPTPSALSCWTPSRSPTPKLLVADENNDSREEVERQSPMQVNILSCPGSPAEPLAHHEQMFGYLTIDHVRRILSRSPEPDPLQTYPFGFQSFEIPRSPLPPDVLVFQEQLLFSLEVYFKGSFESRAFYRNENGLLVSAKVMTLKSPGRLQDLWVAGSHLISDGLFIESRRVFSKVAEHMEILIREEGPRAVTHLIFMFLCLGSTHPQMAALLRKHVGEIAESFLPEEQPLRKILCLIGSMDDSSLTAAALANSWKRINSIFEEVLGRMDENCLLAHLDYLQVAEDLANRERFLRDLVEECKGAFGISEEFMMCLSGTYSSTLYDQGKFVESLASASDVVSRARRTSMEIHEAQGLQRAAHCEYAMGNMPGAEMNIRLAIAASQRFDGESSSMALRMIVTFQTWLRSWERNDESKAIDAYLDKILGPDDIDDLEVID